MGLEAMILVFLIFSLKPTLLLPSFTLIKRLFRSSSVSAIRVVSSTYLRSLMFPPSILIPACKSSSLAFLIMCSASRLNKQGDSRQTCHTSFSILNQSVVPYGVLTVASWPTNRFLRRQGRWPGIPVSLRAFHSLTWSTLSKALAYSMKQRQIFFWNSLAFSIIQWMLAIWSLVPLPFPNPAWISGISWLKLCWSLECKV